MSFHLVRRQQFLSEDFYKKNVDTFEARMLPYFEVLHSKSSTSNDRRRVSSAIASHIFENFILRYTAGVPIDSWSDDFENIIVAFERSAKYESEFENKPGFPPLFFSEIGQYERIVQLIGLCYLLHRRDLLKRIANLFDGMFASKDTLYEDLLAYELDGRYEVDTWYHENPYRDLINCLYRESSDECVADLKNYMKGWYRFMVDVSWHDSHLRMNMGGGGYFGYWAIEAAAVAYLLEIDDSSFRDHIVYPKDLVDYARQRDQEINARDVAFESSSLRTPSGAACPKTGFWFTPAQQNSRRFFSAGQIMPAFDHSEYGATIWQWSEEQ